MSQHCGAELELLWQQLESYVTKERGERQQAYEACLVIRSDCPFKQHDV